MSRLKTWWSQPDQFEGTTVFLRQRGLLRSAQMIMAGVAASGALAPLTVLLGQRPASAVVIGGLAAVFTLGTAILWLTRWPSRRQSEVSVAVGVSIIVGWCLVERAAAIAALGCTAMAITGAYIAFFHRPRILLYNGVVAVAITTAVALQLAREANIAEAATAFWLISSLNVSVPVAIWGMAKAMGLYWQRSQEDPLTGLLNRRAFAEAVNTLLANPPLAHTHLVAVMVDLDDFKRINDTHGHLAGDRALRAVAELLRQHTPPDAIICRAGGEEFTVALTCETSSDVEPLAARFCAAVANLAPEITASVGTASAELHQLSGPDGTGFLGKLLTIADSAMYAAKRRGGNQAQHNTAP